MEPNQFDQFDQNQEFLEPTQQEQLVDSIPQSEPLLDSTPQPPMAEDDRQVEESQLSEDEVSAHQEGAEEPSVADQPLPPPVPYVPTVPYYQPVYPKDKKSGKKWLWILLPIGVVLTLALGGVFGFVAGRLVNQVESGEGGFSIFEPQQGQDKGESGFSDPSSFDVITDNKGNTVYSYEQIVETVSPAIVNITVYSPDGKQGSYASGIIMDAKQGYVLTNDHIYSDIPNAKFLITLNDGTEFKATFVSGDERSDIAILKIADPKNLVAATFSTDPVAVGERVLAIGQSYGYADTVTEGIVSAVNRRVTLTGGSYSERYIQTTTAINPGNSGGALVNLYGQVVGVTSAKIAVEEVEGLAFAIPADRALAVVKNLQENGVVKGRAKLGITYQEAGTITAEAKGVPTGLYVQGVDESSDMARQGVVVGDVITKVNGKNITIASVLLDVIEEAKAGEVITLEVYKADTKQRVTLDVRLMESVGSNSYQVKDTETNDLPENPFEYYFGN